MRKLLVAFLFLSISTISWAQSSWTADPMHSKLSFGVVHLGISEIDGLFNQFKATIQSSKEDFSDAVFELTVETKSVNTQVEMRDNHLRSADFFDVEKFPTMQFKSVSLTPVSKDQYLLRGNLTLNGVTKPVAMNLWYRGTITDAKTGKKTAGFQLTGIIKRSDYNFGSKFPSPMLSDEVRIKADGEFHVVK